MSSPILTRAELKARLAEWEERREHCPECHGIGHPFIDCGNELSGHDYRVKCDCCGPLTTEEEALTTALYLREWLDNAIRGEYAAEIWKTRVWGRRQR
jgi:hypothetical protein